TFQNTVNAETDERLDYSPQYLVKAGAYAPILDAMIIGLNGRYMSSQYKLAHPNETARRETDGNFVTDMTLTSKPILNVLRLRLSVTNLLDTDYEFPIERYDIDLDGDRVPDKVLDSATQDGRRFVVSATAQF
ncbi:MAG: TonB-dependent receptor, partial [Candidatus Poribacteria bacterium]|nr:TonB-dependent receptor [Candidatus Poribacteria bacterium]